MRRNRKVKILATLGPASKDEKMIKSLWEAGADVFRINMSHSSHEMLREYVKTIRGIEREVGRPIGILADLQGPKLRLGEFADGSVLLVNGANFRLDGSDTPGDVNRVCLPHPELFDSVEAGHALLLDDGKVCLRVVARKGDVIDTKVEVGGKMSNRKGVSFPDSMLNLSAMTPKDHSDLTAALEAKVDWIALSFIQRPEDVAEVRKIVRGSAGILSKIEKPQAVERIAEIVELSDALMVARGDLGVEMPLQQVPGVQKQITRAARRAGKPVIVATQMLESMIESPVPTRAEVSDVATAVYDGADAIMLSAESAAGSFPLEAVQTMNSIAEEVEQDQNYQRIIHSLHTEPEATGADAISAAARQIAETLNLAAIVCYTSSGATGLRAARERPQTPIITLSPIPETARRLSLVWGLHSVVSDDAADLDDMVDRACRLSHREGFAKPGQRLIVTAGVPLGTPGATNMLRVAFVGADGLGGI
ncbi:MAG: pyruvate kinase [Cohaesibacteraceae bacterium]|nr:pyruvate kinase [Cohaesibacteraceae bacterium]